MAKPVAIKPEEQFAVSYADSLILNHLTEMESAVKLSELADRLSGVGIGLATVRSLLASDPERFAYHERRWIPASRLHSQDRPLAEALSTTIRRFGTPIPIELVATELSRVRKESYEQLLGIIERMAKVDPVLVKTKSGMLAIADWGFVAIDEPVARALAMNNVTPEELAEVKEKTKSVNWRSPDSIAQALKVAAPVRIHVLGAAAYTALNGDNKTVLIYDFKQFFSDVISTPGFVLGMDGVVYPESESKKWITTAIRVADRLAPTIEVEDAAPIDIKPEAVSKIIEKILAREDSTTTTKLLEETYEITPANKTFPDDMTNLFKALAANKDVQWVGGDRFRKAGTIPDYILEVPEPFHYEKSTAVDEEGELIDVELTDDGLSTTLRKLLQHPLATDVLDEDVVPAPKTMPDTLRLVLKSIHRELGTFPLCQVPTDWLSTEPALQELILIDPSGRELQAWVNTQDRLMYNLIDWWYEQPIENGAVFTLTKTPRPNVFDFEWLDQPDPVVYISSQRMEELRQIGAQSEGRSTLDLLIQVMNHWPKGADYLTLLAEVNVVRRSTRRLIGSLLSSYQCFYQRSGSPVWHFDPKKVEQGFDKTKKKFIKK